MADWPTIDDVRDWAAVSVEDITDDQIEDVLRAEIEVQLAYCTFLPWDVPDDEIPDPLRQALLRRCARAFAARGVPLGSLPTPSSGQSAEYGLPRAMLLPRLDAEIERYEWPYRMYGIA